MSEFIINGGKKLTGEISVDTCKNAILPIMAGSILCKGIVEIKDCPNYLDVEKMCNILMTLGSIISYDKENRTLKIDNRNLKFEFISNNLTKDIRASIFTLGPMIARFGKAKISYPGGCAIGQRSVSTHTGAFKQLGVEILEQHGYLYCKNNNLSCRDVFLDIPSVGATENIMMFLSVSNGEFKIHNCAKEPEIVDLQNFLNKMGTKISGAGSDCITIKGVHIDSLKNVEYKPIPDRIIAGTLLIAGAITNGDIILNNCTAKHINSLIDILKKSGCKITIKKDKIHLVCKKRIKGFDKIETQPYPGFATDLQSQLTTLASVCDGVSLVKENLFECRFRYVPELIKMGAKIKVTNNVAVIEGKKDLYGAEVYATDLRGGVALVIAGLVAKGYTTIHDIEYIDRGYYELEKQLSQLGADIKRL